MVPAALLEARYVRPVSNLRSRYPEVGREVRDDGLGSLTGNGLGSMAAMGSEQLGRTKSAVEAALDAADRQAATVPTRHAHDEVFSSIRAGLGRERA